MKQKIIKVGNSAAVTLPASFVREGNLKIGDEVIVEAIPRYQAALIKPKKADKNISLSPEFFSWLDKISKEYEDVIKELANR
jgi:putative addiction module antidote